MGTIPFPAGMTKNTCALAVKTLNQIIMKMIYTHVIANHSQKT